MQHMFRVSGTFYLTITAWEVVKETEKQLQLKTPRSTLRLNKRDIGRVDWDGTLWTPDYEKARAHLYALADEEKNRLHEKLTRMAIEVAKLDEQFDKGPSDENICN